jgi:hypothetical protein
MKENRSGEESVGRGPGSFPDPAGAVEGEALNIVEAKAVAGKAR